MSSESGSMSNPGAGGASKRRSMLPPPKSYTKTRTADRKVPESVAVADNPSVTPSVDAKCETSMPTVPLSQVQETSCLKVGDRVKISGVRTGVVRFCGQTHFAEGQWYGIELDEPEGRHDGLVEGKRYFQCKPKHGLFAPVHKVEVFTEDLYMYDSEAVYVLSDISSCDERSPSPENDGSHSKRVLPKRSSQLQHSRSRLAQKKTFQSRDLDSTDTTSSSRESSTSHEPESSELGRVKRAEKRSATDGASACRADETFIMTCLPHEKKTKISHNKQEAALNVTYKKEVIDENSEQLLDVCKSSRVDDHTAHVLAYGLDPVASDTETKTNMNETFLVQKHGQNVSVAETQESVTQDGQVYENGKQPEEDSLSSQMVRQPSLEWDPEEEGDKLTASSCSMMSSFGILSDSQLINECNVFEELSKNLLPKDKSCGRSSVTKQKHIIPEVIEADLDKEIAGMVTPEIDVSSSTVSGKEDGSSPEPDQAAITKRDLDLSIALPSTEKSKQISPPQSAQKSAGEKLATPSTEEITVKDYGDKFQNDALVRSFSCGSREIEDLNLKEHRLSASFELAKTAVEQYASLVKGAEEEKTIQNEKGRSLKMQDVMSFSLNSKFLVLADPSVKGLSEETFPETLNASCVLDPGTLSDTSPDDTYLDIENPQEASFMREVSDGQSTSVERANATETLSYVDQISANLQPSDSCEQDHMDVDVTMVEDKQVCHDAEGPTRAETPNSPDKERRSASLVDRGNVASLGGDSVIVSPRSDHEQLMADLEAGHTRVERPVSLVSSCSADTGIIVDYGDVARERPFSMVSTCSADTGYQPEQDAESVSTSTSYPLAETHRFHPSDVVMQSDIAMDTEVMSEIQAPPASGATDVTFEADRVDEHRFSEDHVSSDQEQPTSPEGVTVTADPGEMSGTESQQGEEFGEITVQEELTPEAAEECDDITVRLTNEQAEVETAFTSGKDQTSMVLATVEVMETEMVESATMRDVMEKCVAIESEKLVQNIEVEAHIEKRELGADIVSEHKDNISVDELEEQLHEQIIIDEDMDQSVTGVLKTKHIQNDRCADDMIIDDTNPTNDDGINDDSKSSEQKNDVKQVKDKVKGSTVTHLQRPGSQLNRKRKDDDSRTSKLQTKSSRHQQQSNPRRTNTKTSNQTLVVQSKVTNKMESEKKVSPNKMLKNVSNKKKAEKSLTKTTIGLTEKKGKPAEKNFDKEKSLAKVRKELDMLPSVPSENIAPHLKTIEVRPILENPSGSKKEDGVTGKSIRRSLPQRKFSMVKSQIDSGLRTSTKAEAKTRKSDMSQGSSVAKTAMQSRLSINQPSSGPSKRTSLSSTSATSNTGSKTSQTSKTKPGPTSGRTAKQSRLSLQRHQVETPVSSSQQSLSSDHSQSGATSERTPSKRKPSSFRERSSSTGSEYQWSDLSEIFSQGQQSSTADVKTVRSKPPSGRQSLLPAPGKRTVTDTRRSSASVLSSQGATSKLSKRSHSLVTSTPAPKRNISLAKSKTQKGGLSSSLSSSVKQNQQPDVVTNAISRSSVAKEITRLEALCEARTKELNKIKIELRRQNIGFEAVAIVVKYFTEELAEAKEQLKKAVLQLEELTRQRDALIDEIQSIKQQHAEETESLMSKHQEALSALSKKLTAQKEEEVKQVIEKHSHEVTTLKSFHERSIKELEEKHERLMAENSKQYEEELTRRRHDHEKQINDLHQEHESKLNEITMRFETIKLNLLEKVEFLRMEGEELRRREAAMTEKCQRESDYKIQHALAQYKQDVDSLTAVLDLRNGELRELQKQNLELQRELEKLPVAQEKIKSLEQQIENLQAIIDIRANNERSLSEKHHVLLRKYDKETKVMKRLSMDNEELMYRLQMESGYQDVMRRSISHSPTSSETSTPEPIRRHKSPLPHSPRSPCEPKRSPVQKTPPRSSMKRTGTYEVLPQEYDDMNNIKQSDI